MKSVLVKSEQVHYVSECEMIKFIELNSDMEWNDICDYVRNKGITSDEGMSFWEKHEVESPNATEKFNDEQIYWICKFFAAHSWIEKMMVVFDD